MSIFKYFDTTFSQETVCPQDIMPYEDTSNAASLYSRTSPEDAAAEDFHLEHVLVFNRPWQNSQQGLGLRRVWSPASDITGSMSPTPMPETTVQPRTRERGVASKCRRKKDRIRCGLKDCSLEFTKPEDLASHLHVHVVQDTDVQPRTARSIAASERRRIHEPKFPCDVQGCPKKYTSRLNLKNHFFGHHLMIKRYKCGLGLCDYRSRNSSDVKRHVKQMHKKKTPPTRRRRPKRDDP
ncbi:hypothetical protein B0H34DRAFT_679076 [Crassisporium funariophilum]|nr:hypothetical protein B0H34DRAFT_679076 [Crassisporium funariophilum]